MVRSPGVNPLADGGSDSKMGCLPEHTSLAPNTTTLTSCPSALALSKILLTNDVPVIPEPITTESACVGNVSDDG
jgi:hypothetical protein